MHRTPLKTRGLLKAQSIVITPASTLPAALPVSQARGRARIGNLNSMIRATC